MKWLFGYFRSLSENALFPKMKNTNRNHECCENDYGLYTVKKPQYLDETFFDQNLLVLCISGPSTSQKLFPGLYIIMEITKYLF